MKEIKVNLEELENFLNYLNDKVEECYKKETDRAIAEYLKEIKELI